MRHISQTAGIKPVLETPGYEAFRIEPVIGGSLTWAKAEYESLYGTIRSEWQKVGEDTVYHFEIPVNTSAEIKVQGTQACFDRIRETYPQARYEDGFIICSLGSGSWDIAAHLELE